MSISQKVQDRFGNQRLVELTNPDNSSATTINQTMLDAAIDDAQGLFEQESGIALDENNKAHVKCIITGVLYFLELYKGRDAGIMKQYQRTFLGDLQALRKKVYIAPQTNSQLKPSRERANQLPDMDPMQPAFRGGVSSSRLREYADF